MCVYLRPCVGQYIILLVQNCGNNKSGDGKFWFGHELAPLDLQHALRVVLRESSPSIQPSNT